MIGREPWSACTARAVLFSRRIASGRRLIRMPGCASRAPRGHSVHGPRLYSYSQNRREYTEQVQPRADVRMIRFGMFGLVLFYAFGCWSRSDCMLLFSAAWPSPVCYLCAHGDNRRGRDEKIIVTAMSIFASEDSVAAASGSKQRNGIIVTI